jgi:hypothetical protein
MQARLTARKRHEQFRPKRFNKENTQRRDKELSQQADKIPSF